MKHFEKHLDDIRKVHARLSFAFGVPLGVMAVFCAEPVKSIIKRCMRGEDEVQCKESVVQESLLAEQRDFCLSEVITQEDTIKSISGSSKEEEETVQNPICLSTNKLLCSKKDTTALQISNLLNTLLRCPLTKQQKVSLLEAAVNPLELHKTSNLIETACTIILNVINNFLYLRFVTTYSLLDLLLNAVKLYAPLSGSNTTLYLQKYNKLMKEVDKHFHSGKDIGQLCDCFIEQYNYIEHTFNDNEINRALMSPGILTNAFGKNGVEVPELLKIPGTHKEIAIESFRKFFLFKKWLPLVLPLTINSDEKLIRKIQSSDDQEANSMEDMKTVCFECKEKKLLERVLVEGSTRVMLTKADDSKNAREILQSIKYTELATCIAKEDSRRIRLKKTSEIIELIFEETEKAIEIYERIISNKEKNGRDNLIMIEEYLKLSLIHICRCRRYAVCRSRWSPYH
eukprot:TRINITY_DN5277_c0_g1_i6.p1 TRINITY_DN5277_c0_g1~~TRINITY_DN5277_c0_g1_i6.p1  ORF type:complete len:456 (-),score=75.07 TRINITY_DN5277_c0_g1_i6:20-1387(-)